MRAAIVALAFAVVGSAAHAQVPATPTCAVDDSKLPVVLSGWTGRAPLAPAVAAAGLDAAKLTLGRGVDAALKRDGEVTFPVKPGRPGTATTYGGVYAVDIGEAGDYQVSLGGRAWIELARDGALVESTRHAEGVVCTSLKKAVVFPLKPGRYVLEITGNTDPALAVMVSKPSI